MLPGQTEMQWPLLYNRGWEHSKDSIHKEATADPAGGWNSQLTLLSLHTPAYSWGQLDIFLIVRFRQPWVLLKRKSHKPSCSNYLHSSAARSNFLTLQTILGSAGYVWLMVYKTIFTVLTFPWNKQGGGTFHLLYLANPILAFPSPLPPQRPPPSLSRGMTLWSQLFRERAGTQKINAFPGHITEASQPL